MKQLHRTLNWIKSGAIAGAMTTALIGSSDLMLQHDARMSMDVDSLEKLAMIYPKSAREVVEWCDLGIQLAQLEMDTILAVSSRTFDNTVRALDLSKAKLSMLASTLGILNYVSPDAEIRDAVREASTKLQEFSIDLYLNPLLYQALQEYHDLYRDQESLNAQNELLLDDWLEQCKRKGLHLPSEQLQRVKQLYKQLDQIEQDFMTNISSDVRTLAVSYDDMRGLSESIINRLSREGDLYLLSSNYPTYCAVIEQCHVAKTRQDMFMMYTNLAYPQNDTLLKELLQKRDELAQLLGYEHFAAMDLASTSAQTGDVVEKFLTDLALIASKKAAQEVAVLKMDLPEGVECRADGALNWWDYWYTVAQYKKKHFNMDEELIAEYLPTHKVVDGVLSIYQNFLGLTFKQVKPVWVWHEDVQLIEIYRQSSGELLGFLYLDLYPRPNKYGHACMFPQKGSYLKDGKNTVTVAAIIANFPPPSQGRAALLTHDAVVTFFHEFGHAMHQMLGRTEHSDYSGASVKADFVETPSQMFEQWMQEAEMLAKVSGHYLTGEQLPAKLIEQKIQLQTFTKGYQTVRQCMIALFSLQLMQHRDLSYHPALLWKSLCQSYGSGSVGYVEENHWYTAFGHLSSAELYASKYYAYLWTLVFACDLYSEIKKHGFNAEYSAKVVQLLSAGGSVSPNVLLQNFLGRDPNQEAFLIRLGLK